MEFKKCNRCGCFFVSDNSVCCKCSQKDESEITRLKNYFEENDSVSSLEELSNNTGITIKNLDRFMALDDFKNINQKIDNNNYNNISVSL